MFIKLPYHQLDIYTDTGHFHYFDGNMSLAWRRKSLTDYCFKYTDRPFRLWIDDVVQ